MEEIETTAGMQGESPFGEVRTPRLSILHLMLWTLCSGVHLSLIRAVSSLQGDLPGGMGAIRDTSNVIQGIITGAVLAGALVLVGTRVRRGPPMLRQPGHWLLFVPAIYHLMYLPLVTLLMWLQQTSYSGVGLFWLFGGLHFVPAVAYGIASLNRFSLRWKLIFVGLVISNAGHGLSWVVIALGAFGFGVSFGSLFSMFALASLFIIGAIVVVSLLDLAGGARNDWLHWTGVATQAASASVTLLWMIAPRFVT